MKKVKLGEVVTLKKGKKATILNEQTILSQRYIQIDDLRNDNNLKFTESLNMTEALLDDILIAWDGANAGTIGYGLSGAVGSTIMVLKKNEQYKDEIISDYLGVFLESKSQYLRYHSTGATIPHLNKNILLDLKLELLHIEEQENIIRIFNIIKRLITKRKCQLEELNLLVKSRFNEMFGSKKFDKVSISELVDDRIETAKKIFDQHDTIKYIDISSIDNKNYKMTGFQEYMLNQAPSRAQQHIRKGDIVVSTVRPNLKNIAITELDDENLVASSGFCVLRALKCLPEYLFAIICSDRFTNKMTNIVTGANYPAIKSSDIMNYIVPLPPIQLQNEFAEFVAQVDKSQLAIQKSLEELETLKKSLMQEYFG